jgi:hypothetical protein
MCHPRRVASEIARQHVEELIAQAGCAGAEAGVDHPRMSPADLLVMGADQRPYVVRRFVVSAGDATPPLYWVSVSPADSTHRLRGSVIHMVIANEPRSNRIATSDGRS